MFVNKRYQNHHHFGYIGYVRFPRSLQGLDAGNVNPQMLNFSLQRFHMHHLSTLTWSWWYKTCMNRWFYMFYDGFLQLDLALYLRIVPSQHGPVLLQKPLISPYKGLAFLEGLFFLWWSYTDPFPGVSRISIQPVEVFNGVKSSGKVVYFTATFPYICLAIFLVRDPVGVSVVVCFGMVQVVCVCVAEKHTNNFESIERFWSRYGSIKMYRRTTLYYCATKKCFAYSRS